MALSSPSPFTMLPISGVTIPSTRFTLAAVEYLKAHTSPTTVNHCLRSAAFAAIIARKNLAYAHVDQEAIALSAILHDMGWATTNALLSLDKRFEVDGANLARAFLSAELAKTKENEGYDERWLQLIWDAVALHSTPSIALHKQPEVAITSYGNSWRLPRAQSSEWKHNGRGIQRSYQSFSTPRLPGGDTANHVWTL